MKEITGTVTRVGKVKSYPGDTRYEYGRMYQDSVFKFFILIESEEHGEIKAMVRCDAEETSYGFKSTDRAKPWIGDTVRLTTHRLVNGWASVTYNQEWEILEINQDARNEWKQKIEQQKEA